MIIYKITNTVNNKVYIGKHCGTTKHRWETHLKNALDGTRPEHLYKAMNRYGIDKFKYEVLETHPISVGDKFLNEREKFFIKKYNSRSNDSGYNMTDGGDGLTAQFCTTETKEKISNSNTKFEYGAYSCSSGKLFKVFKKRADIKKQLPIVKHVRHVNHACNANNPFFTGEKQSKGVSYGLMWIKLPIGSNFPEKMSILPACNKKPRATKGKKSDGNEIAQYTLSGQLIKTYPNVVTQVANEVGTEYTSITNAINGKSSSHMGFIWRVFPENKSPNRIDGLRGKQIVTFSKKQITSLPIYQKLDGKEVSRFDSALEAILITDMKPTELFNCLNNGVEDSDGFSWSWV